uniref:Probable acyl-activating enzyme 1, peroxisomal n=1 Tax=Elaeis guineensis var. tenera TaxID=51953 RepID=A0A8N4EY15_ELAGV|nr:probable acyl-activating enzyme 1, peroxisomal [Elaeis guineensis]
MEGSMRCSANYVPLPHLAFSSAPPLFTLTGWLSSVAPSHILGAKPVNAASASPLRSPTWDLSRRHQAVLFGHPAVLEAAVVGRPDQQLGETPCAFVKLKEGASVTADDIIELCCSRLPHYMAPKTVVFEDLPKTSTGKTQKYILREKAKAMGSLFKKD